jgi:anti-sigma-K factor RskA
MATPDIDSFRKYSFNISLNEAINQLNEQLCQLLDNSQLHFSKRKKLLLKFERKNNQFRRSINRLDSEYQKKLTKNSDIIRRIKKKIIDEDRQQRQRGRDEHEQNTSWSLSGITVAIVMVVAGVISITTFVIMMLDKSKEKYI